MRNLQNFLVAFLLTAAGAIIAFQWVDRPISYFAHDHSAGVRLLVDMTRIPEIMNGVAVLIFLSAGIYALIRRPMMKLLSTLLLCGVSIGVSTLIKDQLKFAFGRTWPETWVGNNPSLIRDGAYGFNFFHGGAGYAAFPSGHMTVTCAAAAVLWVAYPRWRPLWAAMVAAVAIGLIGANYHFLSDVITGAFLGAATGRIATLLWDAGGLPRVGPSQN